MKKLILIGLVATLMSCQKEDVILKEKPSEFAWAKKHDVITTTYSEPYNQTIFDSCINDSIHLSGLETYKLSQYSDSIGNGIRYEIDLTNITGISKRDSTIYSGGGKIVNIVRENYLDTSTISKINMRIVYKSYKDKIVFRQIARFVEVKDVIKVDFNTGYIESCKLN